MNERHDTNPYDTDTTDCERLHSLLDINGGLVSLQTLVRQFADLHLSTCEACRREQHLLTSISAKWSLTPQPQPHGAIRSKLHAVIRRQHTSVLDGIFAWLRLPAPAYTIAVIALLIAGVSGVQTERAPQLLMIQTVPSLVDTSAPLPELTRTDSDNVLANFRLLDRLQRPEFPDSAARVLPYRRVDG